MSDKSIYWSFINYEAIREIVEFFGRMERMTSKEVSLYMKKGRSHIAQLLGIASYLGFIKSIRRGEYVLTEKGTKFYVSNSQEKKEVFCKSIEKYPQVRFTSKKIQENLNITAEELGKLVTEEYQRDWNEATTLKNGRILYNWWQLCSGIEKKSETNLGSKLDIVSRERELEIKDLYKQIGALENCLKGYASPSEIMKELDKLFDIAKALDIEEALSIINLMRKHFDITGGNKEVLISDLDVLYNEILK
ncbi:MAG: AAA-associated domain-containing protein [Methanomicrobia archaeon]|nr:AAA-associated domain-containing protein [Methanomicrobia archaeon]